jgi:hypothetical protein
MSRLILHQNGRRNPKLNVDNLAIAVLSRLEITGSSLEQRWQGQNNGLFLFRERSNT